MSAYTPPPVLPVRARLRLAGREIDLATRALVAKVVPSPTWARESEVIAAVSAAAEAGADLAEVPADPRLLGPAAATGALPVAARVTTPDGARAAGAAGADLVLVPREHLGRVGAALAAGDGPPFAVLAADARTVGEVRAAEESAGAPTPLVAIDTLHLPGVDLVTEASLALSLGARLVRTADVRRARRVVEVMAALVEARR